MAEFVVGNLPGGLAAALIGGEAGDGGNAIAGFAKGLPGKL